MKTNTIITIGREFGSAGREIGYKVAKEFGIKLYDKEMLARAAKESGICEEPKGHDFLQTIGSLAQARQDGTATCEAKGDGTD